MCKIFCKSCIIYRCFNNDKPTPKNQHMSKSDNAARSNIYALQAGNQSFKCSLSGGNFVAMKATEYWLGNQSPDVFEMANKLSDLDLKFVCIDSTIVNKAVVMHTRIIRIWFM